MLLLDVDGVLNPYAAKMRPDGFVTRYVGDDDVMRSRKQRRMSNTLVWLDPNHSALNRFDVHWCTMWGGLANKTLSPFYDWDARPVVGGFADDAPCGPGGNRHLRHCDCLHPKTRAVLDHVGDNDFVWVDDEARPCDVAWLDAHHAGRHLVIVTDPAVGLTSADIACVANFLGPNA